MCLSVIKRLFSVMQRRDDLPEMRLPLAVLFMLLTAVFSCAGVHMMSAALVGEESLVGAVVSLVFIPPAVCCYAMIILLWRRYASLLTTPVTAAALYITGANDFYSSVVFLLSVLVVSYAFAVSMISRETKFRRITSVTVAMALCVLVAILGYLGMRSLSVEKIASEVYYIIKNAVSFAYLSLGVGITEYECSRYAREIVTMLPAYIGILSLALAAVSDILARAVFRVLDCENVFIMLTSDITMTKSYAIVYVIAVVLISMTAQDGVTLFSTIARSVAYVMAIPCAVVGVSSLFTMTADEYFLVTKKRAITLAAVVFLMLFVGFYAFIVLASVFGAVNVIAQHTSKTKKI